MDLTKVRNLLRINRGSVTLLVTFAVVVLVGASSLVLDMGHVFLMRHRLCNALDAAALAAAQELPDGYGGAPEVAEAYFNSNGVQSAMLEEVEISGDRRTVTAGGYVNVNYFLAGVLGINSTTVNGTAAARISPLASARGVVPVGIEEPPEGESLQFGVEYNLKMSAGNSFDDYLGSGNFGCLDFQGAGDNPGGGSNEWRDDFRYGHNSVIKVGDVVETISGNRSGPAQQGVNHRVNQCDHACTATDYDPSCPRVVVVPVYEKHEIHGNKVISVKIVGFAAFLLTDYTGSGNQSYIKGRFLEQVVEGEGDSENVEDFGCYAVKLIV